MNIEQNPEIISISIRDWAALAASDGPSNVTIRLHGNSMRPLVRKERDFVTIAHLTRKLKRGDVVLFQARDGRYTVHRVIRLLPGHILTQGDNCRRPDSPTPLEDVFGLVVQVKRGKLHFSIDNIFSRFCGLFWIWILPVRKFFSWLWDLLLEIKKRIFGVSNHDET